MKRSKATEGQIVLIWRKLKKARQSPKSAAGQGSGERHSTTGGRSPSEVKRPWQLEEDNDKLKKLVADLSLDKAMLQAVVRRKRHEACPAAEDDRSRSGGMTSRRSQRPSCLLCHSSDLQLPPPPSGNS